MDQGKHKKILLAVIMLLVISACTISGTSSDAQTPLTPTPNLTLTEWFRPTSANTANNPTATPGAQNTEAPQTDDSQTATEAPADAAAPTQPGTDDTTDNGGDATLIPAQTAEAVSFTGGNADILLVAEYLDDAPTIDGDTGDWNGENYALDKIVKGSEFYANAADLSGDFKIGWDNEYLYLGVTVRDTQFVQTSSSARLGLGDSLEVLLDTQWEADLTDDELSADDFQLGFSPGNLKEVSIPEGYLWAPTDRTGPLTISQVAGRLTNDGYMMEVAISWEELGVVPTSDMNLGFLLSVSDNDSISQMAQQSVVSFASERALTNPSTWVPLVLINP